MSDSTQEPANKPEILFSASSVSLAPTDRGSSTAEQSTPNLPRTGTMTSDRTNTLSTNPDEDNTVLTADYLQDSDCCNPSLPRRFTRRELAKSIPTSTTLYLPSSSGGKHEPVELQHMSPGSSDSDGSVRASFAIQVPRSRQCW